MTHTVDSLMALADGYANSYMTFHEKGMRESLRATLTEALAPTSSPECWCETCVPNGLNNMRMILCPDCGNKRCPKANDHRNTCTNSNDVGQKGSSWEHVTAHPIDTSQERVQNSPESVHIAHPTAMPFVPWSKEAEMLESWTNKTVDDTKILARGRFHAFKGEDGEPDDWEWFEAGTECEGGCVDAVIVRADSIQAAQPVREPLPDDDISDIWDSWLINITDKISAIQFAREIEKAHGIGGDK